MGPMHLSRSRAVVGIKWRIDVLGLLGVFLIIFVWQIDMEGFVDQWFDLIPNKWRFEHIRRIQVFTAIPGLIVRVAGDHDERGLLEPIIAAKHLADGQPVSLRHIHINKQQVRWMAMGDRQRVQGGCHCLRSESHALAVPLNNALEDFVIIGDEYGQLVHRQAALIDQVNCLACG